MEEIKVNDYVRLDRNQGIRKIQEIEDDCYYLDEEIADEWGETAYSIRKEDLGEEVLKHSPNIIDVIEVGDYVNGKRVEGIDDKEFYDHREIFFENECWYIKDYHIKSIVTHEQFNSIKYEVI